MRTTLITLFLLFSSTLISQIYLEPIIVPPTSGNSNGILLVNLVGYSGPVNYEISAPSGVVPTVYGDSMGGIPYQAGVGHTIIARAFSQTAGDTLAELLTVMSDYVSEIDFVNLLSPTNDLACDGSVLVDHNFAIGSSTDYEYSISLGSLGNPSSSVLSTSPSGNNMCSAYNYFFNVHEAGGPGIYYSGSIKLQSLTPGQGTPSYTADVFSTVSDTLNCTATSYAIVNGMTPPYQYSWDGGTYSLNDTFPNVCPGMHVLQIVDNLNDTLGMNFGVVDYTQLFQNPDVLSLLITDTISFNTQNCSFDYTVPVDSSEITYFEEIDNNTIYFEMDIWQSGSLDQVSDTVSCTYDPAGYNLLSLTMYCGTKSVGSDKIYQIIDYVTPSALSMNEKEVAQRVKIYPNPSNGVISIKMDKFKDVSVFNAMGTEVGVFEESELDLRFLTSGVYFLSIRNAYGEVILKRIALR